MKYMILQWNCEIIQYVYKTYFIPLFFTITDFAEGYFISFQQFKKKSKTQSQFLFHIYFYIYIVGYNLL